MSRPIRRRILAAASLTLLAVLAAGGCAVTGSGRDAWRGDFEAVVVHLEKHYANLETVVERCGLDVAALTRRAHEQIDGASTHFGCSSALTDYVAAFGDPHLRLTRPWHSPLALSVRR